MSDKTENSNKSKNLFQGTVKPSIKLYMIRHAESMNNEIYRQARMLFKGGTPQFDLKGWESYVDQHRTADPSISPKGEQQSEKLKEYLVQHLNSQASHPVKIITSPMNRTLRTIMPTLRELERHKVEVVVNGMYFESEGCHLKDQAKPGMNQKQIRDMLAKNSELPHHSHVPSFVGFDEDPNLGWYSHGTGPETRSESEARSAAFYTWLCEYLDQQLYQSLENNDIQDIYDAGVTLPQEVHEKDHDKLSTRYRRRRTALLIGHGDFMSLCLKRIIAGFGHYVETHGVPHRTAFTHYNTGITELEYFGKGRFLVIQTNNTPHLNDFQDQHLKTGGSLKDGWSYLMPSDKIFLYEEVLSAFEDELDEHIKEQTNALKNLYLNQKGRGSFLIRKNSKIDDDNQNQYQQDDNNTNDMMFFIQRGLQVVACVKYNDDKSVLSEMVIRPSAINDNLHRDLIHAVISHAKNKGKAYIFVEVCSNVGHDDDEIINKEIVYIYEQFGFTRMMNNDQGNYTMKLEL